MSEERAPKPTREALAANDWENLFLNPAFKRLVYTIFETAGMFASDFHSDSRIHTFGAGRRSLGLDILRTAETYLGPDALLQILAEEMKTQKETSRDRSKSYAEKRTAELGGDALREPGTGLTYLAYDPPDSA